MVIVIRMGWVINLLFGDIFFCFVKRVVLERIKEKIGIVKIIYSIKLWCWVFLVSGEGCISGGWVFIEG